MRFMIPAVAGSVLAAAPVLAAPININFGNDSNLAAWNDFTSGDPALNSPTGLNYADGSASGYTLSWISEPNGINTNGTQSPTSELGAYFPSAVTRSSFYANTVVWESETRPSFSFTLANLDVNNAYGFIFAASRTGVSDNRQTLYTAVGAETLTTTLNAANNTTGIARIDGLLPDVNGTISITVTKGAANTNGNGFSYLNGMIINVPEPTSAGLIALGAGVFLIRRKSAVR